MSLPTIERDQIEFYGLSEKYVPVLQAVLATVDTNKAVVLDKKAHHYNRTQVMLHTQLAKRGLRAHTTTNGTKWFAWGTKEEKK